MDLVKVKSHLKTKKKELLVHSQKINDQLKILAIITFGNRWGEKRIFKYLRDNIPNNSILFLEGGAYGEMKLPTEAMMLGFFLQLLGKNEESEHRFLELIYDLENYTDDYIKGRNSGDIPKGFSTFEIYPIYDPTIKVYGVEDVELWTYQYSLAQMGKQDDFFFEVAKLRSEAMFYHVLETMLGQGHQTGFINMTGFHGTLFGELATEFKVSYKEEFVTSLPKYEA